MPAAVVVLAAGAGTRLGADRNKVLLTLAGDPLVVHSVRAALGVHDVARLVVVARPGEEEVVTEALLPELGQRDLTLVPGGRTRHDSELAALDVLRDDVLAGRVDVVVIHDAARPLAPSSMFEAVVDAARRHGGALPGVAVGGLLRRADLVAVPGRTVVVQTPQAFRAAPLLAAYDRARAAGSTATDTAGVLEQHADEGLRVVCVPGATANLKVTFAEDLPAAQALLGRVSATGR